MKALFTFLTIIFAVTIASSQSGVSLQIEGMKVKSKVISAISAVQTSVPSTPGRRGGPGGDCYVITRNIDAASSAISNAAQTGKYYNKITMGFTLADGSRSTIVLENTVLSDYATNISGGSSTETFKIFYQTQTAQ